MGGWPAPGAGGGMQTLGPDPAAPGDAGRAQTRLLGASEPGLGSLLPTGGGLPRRSRDWGAAGREGRVLELPCLGEFLLRGCFG